MSVIISNLGFPDKGVCHQQDRGGSTGTNKPATVGSAKGLGRDLAKEPIEIQIFNAFEAVLKAITRNPYQHGACVTACKNFVAILDQAAGALHGHPSFTHAFDEIAGLIKKCIIDPEYKDQASWGEVCASLEKTNNNRITFEDRERDTSVQQHLQNDTLVHLKAIVSNGSMIPRPPLLSFFEHYNLALTPLMQKFFSRWVKPIQP